jgi:DNA-binding YbaB/EbfC family protein
MSKGFPGLPGNLQGLMKQAQKMQQQLQDIQAEAEQFEAEGSAGGGVVRVVVNGKHEMISIAIDPQVVNPADVEMLQDLVRAATNDAHAKVQEHLKGRMSSVTGGMGIPGLF